MSNEKPTETTFGELRLSGLLGVELEFLESWLHYAAEPIGQECCGRGGSECCGSPDPVYLSAEQVIEQMKNRHREIQAMLRGNSGT